MLALKYFNSFLTFKPQDFVHKFILSLEHYQILGKDCILHILTVLGGNVELSQYLYFTFLCIFIQLHSVCVVLQKNLHNKRPWCWVKKRISIFGLWLIYEAIGMCWQRWQQLNMSHSIAERWILQYMFSVILLAMCCSVKG